MKVLFSLSVQNTGIGKENMEYIGTMKSFTSILKNVSSAVKSVQLQVIILNDLSQSQNSKCHFSCVY